MANHAVYYSYSTYLVQFSIVYSRFEVNLNERDVILSKKLCVEKLILTYSTIVFSFC